MFISAELEDEEGGSIRLKTPIVFSIGYLFLFTLGDLTGVVLANSGVDIALHDANYVLVWVQLSQCSLPFKGVSGLGEQKETIRKKRRMRHFNFFAGIDCRPQ